MTSTTVSSLQRQINFDPKANPNLCYSILKYQMDPKYSHLVGFMFDPIFNHFQVRITRGTER